MNKYLKRVTATAFAAAVLGTTASLPAAAGIIDFTGPFDPANWTITIAGTPAQGSASFVGNTQLDLFGGDSGCPGALQGEPGPCEVTVTTTSANIGTFSFNWTYTTLDMDGPAWDLFGMLVDGNRIQLNDPNGPDMQSGTVSFQNASTSFGWYMNCADCLFGPANASITAFQVPEPASLALFGLGFAALGLRRKLRN